MKKDTKIKIGVIGCSNVAKKYFFPVINTSNYAKLGFIGSRTKEKAQQFAKENNCEFFGNYDDVLKSDVNAVYISLPTGLHEDLVVKAANMGKHIICEKSSTTSYESAKKIINACKKNKVRIIEGFSFRFHPQHKIVIKYIKKNQLGKIFSFYGAFGFPAPNRDNIRWDKKLGGGVLNDATCYPICASRMIFQSEPFEVMANFEMDERKNIDVRNNIMLFYSNNRTAIAIAGFQNYFQSTYNIWGTKAMLSTKRAYAVPQKYETSIYLHRDDKIIETKIPPADQFKIMMESFSKTILGIEKPDFNYEKDLLNQARVLEAIRKSDKEKRRVAIVEIN